MEIYYSQNGEDYLLNKLFANRKSGVYAEIGCLDGIEFSNTYYFERKGWRGVCLEAHNDFIAPLRKNRPSASVIHCAVGEADKDNVTFYANKAGSLSTLDKNEEQRWKTDFQQYFTGFEEQKVRMRTLTSVFDELQINEIDFVSLDIEGYEVNALKGLDLNKYKPTVFVIEYKNEDHKRQLEEILHPHGYHFVFRLSCNLFYSLRASDKQILEADHGIVTLHQVEQTGQVRIREVNLSKPTYAEKIKSRLKASIVGSMVRYARRIKANLVNRLSFPSYQKKRRIIDDYRRKNGIKVMVETGTYLGDTVEYFRSRFDEVYSIELSEELYAGAAARFEGVSNVHILQGNSGEVLRALVDSINQPALFWLDGHYSSEFFEGDRYIRTARGEKATPVVEELEILLHDRHKHVILVDDARLFKKEFGYPELNEILEMVGKAKFPYTALVDQDIIRITTVK